MYPSFDYICIDLGTHTLVIQYLNLLEFGSSQGESTGDAIASARLFNELWEQKMWS